MKIIVLGAGKIGTAIIKKLAAEDHEVTVVDNNHDLSNIIDGADVRFVGGTPCYPSVLEEAGANDADMIIAVTGSDEVNMLACLMAHNLFGVKVKIANIKDEHYLNAKCSSIYSENCLNINHITSSYLEVAKIISKRIKYRFCSDFFHFIDSKVSVISVPVIDQMGGIAIGTIIKDFLQIDSQCFLLTNNMGNVLYPGSSYIVNPGDVMYFVMLTNNISDIAKGIGKKIQTRINDLEKIVIAGGSSIGYSVAKHLLMNDDSVELKIVENDPQKARNITNTLRDVDVINGNVINKEILAESGVGASDLFVALTENDSINVLSSIFAKSVGCTSSIALLNNMTSDEVVYSASINSIISLRDEIAKSVVKYVKTCDLGNQIEIINDEYEMSEIIVEKDSAIVGSNSMDIFEKFSLLPLAVSPFDKEKAIIFIGKSDFESYNIAEGDKILFIFNKKNIKNLESILINRGAFY